MGESRSKSNHSNNSINKCIQHCCTWHQNWNLVWNLSANTSHSRAIVHIIKHNNATKFGSWTTKTRHQTIFQFRIGINIFEISQSVSNPRTVGKSIVFSFFMFSLYCFCNVIYRVYKDESEKWIVAEKCLKMFDFFVKTYEINSADFSAMGQNKDEYPPPGFYIMLEMNTNEKSELLKWVLNPIQNWVNVEGINLNNHWNLLIIIAGFFST